MPGKRTVRLAGEVTQETRYLRTGFAPEFPDSLTAPRPGSVEQTPGIPAGDPPVQTLAPGVWTVRAGGNWVLAVAFRDHVLLVETPRSGLPDAIARIRTLAPGKPIRYAVPTHHHDDHAGGIRHAVAEGATIVTTAGSRDYLTRMAKARTSIAGDPAGAVAEPRFEVLADRKRIFTDGRDDGALRRMAGRPGLECPHPRGRPSLTGTVLPIG